MIRSVAVVGIGAMGAPMARRIQAAGFELTVCDRNAKATGAFQERGAKVALTPADCANSDIVLVLVATPEQVRSVLLGEHGLVAGVSSARLPLLAVMSTISAEAIREIAAEIAPSGARLIDAPVSGGVLKAEQGALTLILGGDPSDIARAAPVFASFGNRQFHCGQVGDAQTVKVINNILAIANVAIAGEAYRLAIENRLDIVKVAEVLDASTGRNYLSRDPSGPASAFASMVPDAAGFASLMGILRKDSGIAVEMTSRVDGDYPAIAGLARIIAALGDETFANWRRVADADHQRGATATTPIDAATPTGHDL